jgi:lon-related putative ATP-dependent protease
MYKNCTITSDQLKKDVDLNGIDFTTTDDIEPLRSVIGQERAVKAIKFGLEIHNSSYNIYVSGIRGTGRTTIVQDLLNAHAIRREKPGYWAYVYNFENPDEPCSIYLAGKNAVQLESRFNRLIGQLRGSLKKRLETENFTAEKNKIIDTQQQNKRVAFNQIEDEADQLGLGIKSTATGFHTFPVIEGKPMSEEQFAALKPEDQDKIEQGVLHIQKRLHELIREAQVIDREIEEKLEDLDQEEAALILDTLFKPLEEEFSANEQVLKYFDKVKTDIIQNIYTFIGTEQKNEGGNAEPVQQHEVRKTDKYRINIIVNNSELKGAPVVYEMNPTYMNLFGQIEKKSYMGYLYTDYTMIRSGSLHKANGGYLILDIEQILRQPYVYEALKRALRSHSVSVEDIGEQYGITSTGGLKPKPIPLQVKVILIGQSSIYDTLYRNDEDFRKIFKIRANFDYEVKATRTNIKKYVQFISRVVKEENLLPFDRSGVKAVIEQAHRQVSHQQFLSIRFADIVRLIRESSYWAQQKHHKTVNDEHVVRSVAEERYRRNLSEEKVQNAFREHTINMDTDGEKIGQINGLAVYSMGDYSFGRPNRITASTYIGSRGIINIEREAKLSGKIHDKGMLILTGYFASIFGQHTPLSFSASLTFEQSYGMIDGDSASSAELYVILSSLAGVAINQGIAVTGAVNQKGDVQAIGGVNEKIEGFFDICKMNRLTGKQGVMIPCANMKNLILREDVIEAVHNGQFHIWSVDKIEDGIRILTGIPAGQMHKDGSFTRDSIFDRIQQKIYAFSRNAKQFSKGLDAPARKSDEPDNQVNEEN